MPVNMPYNLLLEKELLEKVATGDQLAFTALFKHHQVMVYDYSLRLTRSVSQAEEIVQKVFIRIWLNRSTLPAIENFGAYLNRATRNESYSALRVIAAKTIREVELTDMGIRCDSDASHRVIYNQSALILQSAVDSLPPQRKLVYQLCHEQGLKYDDVAAQLHISPGTVHKHMKLALKTIRENFSQMDAIIVAILLLNKPH
jgi:RNA polymerase sigma-70 factor (family 1)